MDEKILGQLSYRKNISNSILNGKGNVRGS